MSGFCHDPTPHCPCLRRQPRHRLRNRAPAGGAACRRAWSARLDKGQAAAAKLARGRRRMHPSSHSTRTNRAASRRCIAEIERQYGRLDILVNNAAILIDGPGGFDASLFELTDDTMRKTFETNVLGPMRLTQAAVPLMRKTGYGRIVNLCSGAGQLADMGIGFPAYRMSKSALNALTRITAAEVKGAQHSRQCRLPRLGAHRHGRPASRAQRRARRGDAGVARHACRTTAQAAGFSGTRSRSRGEWIASHCLANAVSDCDFVASPFIRRHSLSATRSQ